MGIGIDDANRLVIMEGHKVILIPRVLDFRDFPTTQTAPPSATAPMHYNFWDIYRTTSHSLLKYSKFNDNRLYLYGVASYDLTNADIVLKTNRNIKNSMLAGSMSYQNQSGSAANVYSDFYISLVRPDDTEILPISAIRVKTEWAMCSFLIHWSGNSCNVELFKGECRNGDITFDAGNVVLSQNITDADVRLRIRAKMYRNNDTLGGTTNGYINSVLIG